MKKSILFLAVIAALTACSTSPQNTEHNPVITVHTLVMGDADGTTQRIYVGQLASGIEVNLGFPLGGQLTEVHVYNGQRVKKGDLLARVDDTSARSLHDMALATLHQAEDGYERMKIVYDEGGVSEVRWVQMETDLEKARQSEISTRKHLEDCSLYAPKSGVISMKEEAVVGANIGPLTPLCKLLDLDSMHVLFSVPEQEIGLIEKGDLATATLPSAPGKELSIRVCDKGLLANPMGHTYQVKALIRDPKGLKLLPGQVAKVQMTKTAPTGLIVPSWCVQTMADGLVVWTLKNGKAYRTPITVKSYVKNGVLIESGLQAGDTVITDGYQKLYNEAQVKAIEEEN